ncbi:DNA-directed RNA polymerase subunit G [Candidatus Methanodesulfokora washburnensis]|jgi:hypothetical protein|uniref:Uncharacterized protein n=1 Tax=Candidatus Methanodesulfokora washburnensis TaxID=2478471 RepID=A0A429GVH2_9CREN|nr:DNA-directed RNA polymerase subunit G [Candidatus Methanodesulfokores washburnensis]RSN78006.1 hypothetical protein D6D85_01685 [Candidatus Methanodesulfokores washburnensis]
MSVLIPMELEVLVDKVGKDPLFNLDLVELKSGNITITLDFPREIGAIRQKEKGKLLISKEAPKEKKGYIFSGIVYKSSKNELQISFYGLWMKINGEGLEEFAQGDKVYVQLILSE